MKILKKLYEIDSNKEDKEDKTDNNTKDKEEFKSFGSINKFKKINDEDDSEEDTNKNREGLIRTVKNAHLIYKRTNDTNRYDELWQFKIKNNGVFVDNEIKRNILAGTDIPENKFTSKDGEQTYEIWYSGNVVFLKITNLPN